MGKSGEVWDDSALINAFDEAIFNYKKMHGICSIDNPNGVSGDVKSCTTYGSPANEEDYSHTETNNGENNEASHPTAEAGEVEVTNTGNELTASQSPQDQVLELDGLSIRDNAQNNFSSLAVDEYNELYKQYYEVEEQRQKIMQRLQDLSGWSYTDEGNADASTQEYQSSRVCSCPVASCSSLPGVSDASASMDLQKQQPVENEDVDIVKMAMGAAEKAISTLMNATSGWIEDNKIRNGAEANETDLCTVLNAWYSAGLYTGKYLTEQALAKKQRD